MKGVSKTDFEKLFQGNDAVVAEYAQIKARIGSLVKDFTPFLHPANSPEPNSYQPKLPYPERMKEKEKTRGSSPYNPVNAECSAIILNKVPEKLEDPGKFLIPCALQELDRTNALADSGASINLLPHSIYKQLGLGALKPTRMTLELSNHSVMPPNGL
ncbi:reverse transcriptase domain-containing protein [Tanacetum coccineum]